jgi:pimeloyl-ACP methyl ester carboxylesterase
VAHVGHSTGGGEVVRYIARHGESRVAKAVLISSVPPLVVQTGANPGGDLAGSHLAIEHPVMPRSGRLARDPTPACGTDVTGAEHRASFCYAGQWQ